MALQLETVRKILEDRLVHMGQPKQTLSDEAYKERFSMLLPFDPQVHYAVDIVGTQAALSICVLDGSDSARLTAEHNALLRAAQAERQVGRTIDWLSQSLTSGIVFAYVALAGAGSEAQAQQLRKFLLDLFNDEIQFRLAKAA